MVRDRKPVGFFSERLAKICKPAGYGETYGEEHVMTAFQLYLDFQDLNAAQLKSTNKHVNGFLDFLTGQRQPSDDEASGAQPATTA